MIVNYRVTASERGANVEDNFTRTYCKTAAGFVLDDSIDDIDLTENEADTEYAAMAADGSPYACVCKISVDDIGITAVVEQKTA